jgi:hypothetical protein
LQANNSVPGVARAQAAEILPKLSIASAVKYNLVGADETTHPTKIHSNIAQVTTQDLVPVYTTPTPTSAPLTGGTTTVLGLTQNTWVWIAIGVLALGAIGLIIWVSMPVKKKK